MYNRIIYKTTLKNVYLFYQLSVQVFDHQVQTCCLLDRTRFHIFIQNYKAPVASVNWVYITNHATRIFISNRSIRLMMNFNMFTILT